MKCRGLQVNMPRQHLDGAGKSGGYRVFSFFMDAESPVFLLWIIDKSEDDNLTDAQENVFKALAAALKKGLRK